MSIDHESQRRSRRLIALLKAERERQGLSKYALSAKAQISQQAIGYIETGKSMPAIDTVVKLALALGVSLSEMLREVEDESEA